LKGDKHSSFVPKEERPSTTQKKKKENKQKKGQGICEKKRLADNPKKGYKPKESHVADGAGLQSNNQQMSLALITTKTRNKLTTGKNCTIEPGKDFLRENVDVQQRTRVEKEEGGGRLCVSYGFTKGTQVIEMLVLFVLTGEGVASSKTRGKRKTRKILAERAACKDEGRGKITQNEKHISNGKVRMKRGVREWTRDSAATKRD